MTKDEKDLLESLVKAVRSISHGDVSGPTGLEMLGMAVAGGGLGHPLGDAIIQAGETISDAINNLADAIRESKSK